MVKNEHMSS